MFSWITPVLTTDWPEWMRKFKDYKTSRKMGQSDMRPKKILESVRHIKKPLLGGGVERER